MSKIFGAAVIVSIGWKVGAMICDVIVLALDDVANRFRLWRIQRQYKAKEADHA